MKWRAITERRENILLITIPWLQKADRARQRYFMILITAVVIVQYAPHHGFGWNRSY